MDLRRTLLTTVACLTVAPLAAASPAGAATTAPLGPADGVQATLTAARTLEVRFTGASATIAKVGGHHFAVSCAAHPAASGLQFTVAAQDEDEGASGSGIATAEGVLTVHLDKAVPVDACDLADLDDPDLDLFTPIARVALDPAGAAWIDESVRAAGLSGLLERARTATGYRPVAAVAGGTVVAMAGPSATPPDGQIGYWTDGALHAAVATYSAAGRRLAVEDLGHGMLRTNVVEQGGVLTGLIERLTAALGATGTPGGLGADDLQSTRSPYRGPAVGPGDGVRGHFTGRRVTLRFTGRSAAVLRKVAGRKVGIRCLRRPAVALFGDAVTTPGAAQATVRVPAHGGTLTTTLRAPGDACEVTDNGTQLAVALTTDAGRAWWADTRAVDLLNAMPESLAAAGGTTYLPTATVVAKHPAFFALATPGAPVPPGRVGVWTDGAQHALIAVTSATGRRFVVADEGGGTLRTNLYGELLESFFFDDAGA